MNNTAKTVIAIIALAVVGFLGYTYLTTEEDRTFAETIEDAGNNLDEGFDDAVRSLEDRTPAEKAGDAIEDATDGNAN